ncbi:hypothetical protein OG339_42235 [Streptosporangium sp. NBC_01495]|uniref:hypothetical protein n=1 Tax=Streptosporangium sp. NBC_01495 TaxID=2903899 RepID=UPI002E35BBE0|nr:hypothetical protein [Streptosporangium sp. NBC_01495]
MGKIVLLNSRIFAGAADLTGASNKVELASEFEAKDATNFGSQGWKDVVGGVAATSITGGGQWEAGDPGKVDDAAWAALSGRGHTPWTICPESASAGELAWFTDGLNTSYTFGGQVGEVAPWEAKAAGTSPLLRGVVAHPPGTPRTAAGSGTALNLGPLTTGQRLYVALHVLSVAGTASPSLTVSVESDDMSATSRATFASATSPGGQVISVPGPITDSWWRLSWLVSGTSPSFLFVASVGIA